MNRINYIVLLLYMFVVGCDHVRIDTPFGSRTPVQRLSQVVGRWTDDEHNVFELRLTKSGELVGGHLSWDDATERFKSESTLLDVRTENESQYLFLKDDDLFGFFRIEFERDDEISLYVPDAKVFRDAVKNGSLTGTVKTKLGSDNFSVRLTVDDKLKAILARQDWKTNYLKDCVVRYRRIPVPK